MKKLIPLFAVLTFFAIGCGEHAQTNIDKEETLEEKIARLEPILINDSTFSIDYQVAKELIPAYTKFVNENPNSPKAAEYLIKAAETCQGLGQGNLAVKYYDQFLEKYPDHNRAAVALFQKAFVYETIVGDKEMAIKAYEEFTEKYPDHELAPSAQSSILYIDKSPEELVKEFKAKDQANK